MSDPTMLIQCQTLLRRITLGKLAALSALVLIFLGIFSLTVVETGQVGVVIRSGSDQVRVMAAPGIYMHLPFVERVWLVDTRLQVSEQGAAQTYTTADKQMVSLAAWAVWRVVDPVRFSAVTSAGKSPIDERLRKNLSDVLSAWVAARSASTLLQGQHDDAAWQSDLNQRLAQFGIEATRVGLHQVALSDSAMEAIYARMSASRTRYSRQMIEGLASDERQLVALQTRQQAQVLDEAYRAAQQTRQNAENLLLAAYARLYGSSKIFADTLRSPGSAAGNSGQ